MSRPDGRRPDELRPVRITPGFLACAPSALIEVGATRVLCTAICEEGVPPWLRGQGRGWLTAEYGMLPASTGQRKQRDATKGKLDGRTQLGGDIMIHGNSVSIGCLAMGDEAAEDLFVLAADTGLKRITVILTPVDFRRGKTEPTGTHLPAWATELYGQIKSSLAAVPTP